MSHTVDRVFADAFKMHDTHGVPLTMQLFLAEQRGWSISVPQFVVDARRASWKEAKIQAVVHEALLDNGCDQAYIDAAMKFISHPKLMALATDGLTLKLK